MQWFNHLIEKLYVHQANNLAFYDQQTKVFNRNWLEIWAKNHFRYKEFYVVIIDINNLKHVNDTKGHEYGDNLIKTTANMLKVLFSAKTDYICRLGGDEFLIFTQDVEQLSKLEKSKHIFSYGLCQKIGGMSVSAAMRKADEHMYAMKQRVHDAV